MSVWPAGSFLANGTGFSLQIDFTGKIVFLGGREMIVYRRKVQLHPAGNEKGVFDFIRIESSSFKPRVGLFLW